MNLKNICKFQGLSKNCVIDTGTELDFKKAVFNLGIVCAWEKFQLKLRVRLVHGFANSSLNETFEVTEHMIFVK